MTTAPPSYYRLVLPHPWERVGLGPEMAHRVTEILDAAVARLPKEVPPDQVGPLRRRLASLLTEQLQAAREHGGIDYYLPTDAMHGVQVSASFVVSAVVPSAVTEEGVTEAVLADLMTTRPGAEAVPLGGTLWVRSERVARREADATVAQPVEVRRVEYITAVPDDPRRWIIVAFTTVGDGDPHGELAHLFVELFDAIMTTWRWLAEPADAVPPQVGQPVQGEEVR